jgi:O-succinylbenzoate synthase
MPLRVQYCKHTLNFKFDAGTSRGVLKNKDSFYLKIFHQNEPERFGVGEAGPLKGLSIDFGEMAENKLQEVVLQINENEFEYTDIVKIVNNLRNYPSVLFALETALADLNYGGKRKIFDNNFFNHQKEMVINGLIWMGEKDFMSAQIEKKLQEGYDTIKMKIGAIDFDTEIGLLKSIRANFTSKEVTLRVDANGAFDQSDVLKKLEILSELDIHSIEQPVKQGQIELMAELCEKSPVPIALDEELIGVTEPEEKKKLLKTITPPYIILKPSLMGGFQGSKEWIEEAEKQGIKWWMTSALESNIGLNAICQFTAEFNNPLPQGLGTGQLYTNNVSSPLQIKRGKISYNPSESWDLSHLHFID